MTCLMFTIHFIFFYFVGIVCELPYVLEELLAEYLVEVGFSFTGRSVSVDFWPFQFQVYLFDP